MTATAAEKQFTCSNAGCEARLTHCRNRSLHDVCNWCVSVENDQDLCASCRLTTVIPDLTIDGNHGKWARLEAAKRRLLYLLRLLRLPFEAGSTTPPLSFRFLGDAVADEPWRATADGQQVFTGYLDGVITINIREADSVEREKARVQLGESQRTLLGHFRHEIGHFYWDALFANQCKARFDEQYGDPLLEPYEEAKQRYYQRGPKADWRGRFVSAYATMHPAEDVAETFGAYLDMMALLDTAVNMHLVEPVSFDGPIASLVRNYGKLGIALNEISREMGLLDFVPGEFGTPVIEKLAVIHECRLQHLADD